MADIKAGEIEKILWFTAKERTFSALRGALIETSQVDFWNAESLYKELLEALGYHPRWEDDDPAEYQILDALTEALSIYCCLIVIDDVDSLDPDDQRQVVHSLNSIVQRTVSAASSPSRILLTSRLDQSLPPSAVIPVRGFSLDEFTSFIKTLGKALNVEISNDIDFAKFWEASSGSPLFGGSILRLMKLGAGLDDALGQWVNHDGEEVRRFAFERELKRLPVSAAKALYAVTLMGETSTVELVALFETTTRAVTDWIAALQSYHLIANKIKSDGTVILSAPTEVILVKDIIRDHLGSSASEVEILCARIRHNTQLGSRKIALGIGQVVGFWKLREFDRALIAAKDLARDFPKNGDVACLLGTAYLRISPPDAAQADSSFAQAQRLGCTRPELTEGWIAAKSLLADWQGLFNITSKLISNERAEDKILSAHLKAASELYRNAVGRGDRTRAAEIALAGIAAISRKLRRQNLSHAELRPLWDQRFDLARKYIAQTEAGNPRAGDHIRVFEAMIALADLDVFLSDIIYHGIERLNSWWTSVESRPYIDEGAKTILKKSLVRLEGLERQLLRLPSDHSDVITRIQNTVRDLGHRGAKL